MDLWRCILIVNNTLLAEDIPMRVAARFSAKVQSAPKSSRPLKEGILGSQPQHRGTGAGRVEGHATRGDRPLRLMWPRLTLACTPHGAGRRTELSGELQLFVPRYRSVVGGWKEGRWLLVAIGGYWWY